MHTVKNVGTKILSILCTSIFLLSCVAVNPQEPHQQRQVQQAAESQPAKKITLKHIKPAGVKTAYPEVVVLEKKTYAVPEQWLGRRVDAPPLTREDLTQIPTSLTHNKSKLFLLPEANEALQKMAEAALNDGIQLTVHSAYRSEWYQRKIFSNMFKKGRTFADVIRYVAPPGYSEHALGTVVDFYPSNWRFAKTDEYRWLRKNGARFHFHETYTETGSVPWEAWHWRWIPPGKEK